MSAYLKTESGGDFVTLVWLCDLAVRWIRCTSSFFFPFYLVRAVVVETQSVSRVEIQQNPLEPQSFKPPSTVLAAPGPLGNNFSVLCISVSRRSSYSTSIKQWKQWKCLVTACWTRSVISTFPSAAATQNQQLATNIHGHSGRKKTLILRHKPDAGPDSGRAAMGHLPQQVCLERKRYEY